MVPEVTRRTVLGLGAAATTVGTLGAAAAATPSRLPTDAELARSLPGGFRSAFAHVNGVRLHFVAGGHGEPLVLLGGWPQTWWQFHKVMPALAQRYRVIAVDIRGMGSSAKPASGYDKKTMAADIRALIHHLGFNRVNIAGHDIGAMVAYSFAANHPQASGKVALLDVPHPDEGWYGFTLLPQPGTGPLPREGYLWWFAFNQIRGLPEQLLAGRFRHLTNWFLDNILIDPTSVGERERQIYAAAYDHPDAIRAGNGWYQTFGQDIVDQKTYSRITTPLLGLTGSHAPQLLADVLPAKGTDVRLAVVNNSSHFLAEEQPKAVVDHLVQFVG